MNSLIKQEAKATFSFYRDPKSHEEIISRRTSSWNHASHLNFATANHRHHFWLPIEATETGYKILCVDGDSQSPGTITKIGRVFPNAPFKLRPQLFDLDGAFALVDSELKGLDEKGFNFWFSQNEIFALPEDAPFRTTQLQGSTANLSWRVPNYDFSVFKKVRTIRVSESKEASRGEVHLNRSKSDFATFSFPIENFLSPNPVPIGSEENQDFWLVNQTVFSSFDRDLSPEDVGALANEVRNKRRLQLEKAHSLEAMARQLDSRAKRQTISQDVKTAVWQRDQGRCVECESQVSLEFDHIIPFSMGGSNTVRNLQLLCESCNRRKGATLG
jgi:hypothetical protein